MIKLPVPNKIEGSTTTVTVAESFVEARLRFLAKKKARREQAFKEFEKTYFPVKS
jgi:hypothetical protein